MIRVGVLGCSDIAKRKFIPALLQSKEATLAAVASRQQNKAASFVPSATPCTQMTYQELVCSPAIDLVYISLPNHLHEEWSIRALEQGKHVICEKPLGLTAPSVIRMLAAAAQNRRFLAENLMYLQHPQHAAVKAIIAAGHIGTVLSLRSEFVFPELLEDNFRLKPHFGGGAFHDLNRYPLSAAQFFLAGKTHHILQSQMDDVAGLIHSFQGESLSDAGESFSFLIGFGQPYRSFYTISGEHGVIRVDRAYTTPADLANRITITVGDRDESFCAAPHDHFLGSIEHVCGVIRSGEWHAEHERTRELATLAGMFYDSSDGRVNEKRYR